MNSVFHFKWLYKTTSLLILCSLFGCQNIGSIPSATTTETVISPSESAEEIFPEKNTPVSTEIPGDLLSTPTRSISTPVVRFTPTAFHTLTPLPTLEEDVLRESIRKFLIDNGGCELPCVWGITPGSTTWLEAKQFFEKYTTYYGQGGGNPKIGTSYGFRFALDSDDEKGILDVTVVNYIVEGFQMYPAMTKDRYRLDQMLSRFGEPKDIFIHTYPNSPTGSLRFYLILHYPEIGVSALYLYSAQIKGEDIEVCITDLQVGPEIYAWNPEKIVTVEKAYPSFFSGELRTLPVYEALGKTKSEFTNEYSTLNEDTCLSTPIIIWEK